MTLDVNADWWKTLFDDVYLQTDARSVCDEELTRREVDVICELLPFRPPDRILDLCGGQGRHSLELSARGFAHCTVVDYSPHLIEVGETRARTLGHAVRFVRAGARSTGLPAAHFHHVMILGNSLGYLADENGDALILAEARRVLRPGGRLLMDVADGGLATGGLNPNAWHEIGEDLVICRQREIGDGRIRTRELVLSKERGLVRDNAYAIRLYDEAALLDRVSGAGFTDPVVHRDFSPHGKEGDYGFMNRRILVTARKP